MKDLSTIMMIEFELPYEHEPLVAIFDINQVSEEEVKTYIYKQYPAATRRDIVVMYKAQFDTVFGDQDSTDEHISTLVSTIAALLAGDPSNDTPCSDDDEHRAAAMFVELIEYLGSRGMLGTMDKVVCDLERRFRSDFDWESVLPDN